MRRVSANTLADAAREESVSIEHHPFDVKPVDDISRPAVEDVDDDAVGWVLGEE